MKIWTIVLIVLFVILLGLTIALYFLGKKMEKQRDEQQAQIDANAQRVSMLVIDKKRMKLSESGLPEAVFAQAPWYTKRAKVPIIKVKIGPQIMNLICKEEIFDEMPTKREVKATVSGLYVTSVKGLHGKRTSSEPVKKGWRAKAMGWVNNQREKAKAAKNG